MGLPVLEKALEILEVCPDDCDRSCYRCLRSYKNKFEHDLLDRHIGASLLRYLLTGTTPTLDTARVEYSTDLLYQDLERQGLDRVVLGRNKVVVAPGFPEMTAPILATRTDGTQFVIGLHGPLTPDDPPNDELRELKEFAPALPVILVDELVVRRNLPAATNALIAKLG